MEKLTLRLDIVDSNGDGLVDLIGDWSQRQVAITVVDPHGPGGGNPVVDVEGTAPRLLEWLLTEYVADDLDVALELLAEATPVTR
jgi:hypothetical protein